MHFAAEKGLEDLFQHLIETGIAINPRDIHHNTPLHVACLHNQYSLVKASVKANLDLYAFNDNGETPIEVATKKRHSVIVKFLANSMEAYCNPKNSIDGMTPLHHAVLSNQLNLVDLLTKQLENFEIKDKTGHTPLDYAYRMRNQDMINLLTIIEDDESFDDSD